MKMEKRIILDYIMLLMLFPLMLKPLNGIYAHEIMGVAFVLLTVIHCLNNKGWLKNTGKSIRQKESSPKKLVTLIINSMLIVSTVLVTASGIMISIVIFGFLNIPYNETFYQIHTSAAVAVLVLSLIHLLMHMKMITTFFRKNK